MHQDDEIAEEKQKEVPIMISDEGGMKRHLQGIIQHLFKDGTFK